jgi:hypothetical protein
MREVKNSMKINRRIVLVTLIIAALIGILRGIFPFLVPYFMSRGMQLIDATGLGAYTTLITTFTGYGLNPLALFVASYLLGRDLDLKVELRTTIVSIYLGCFLGIFMGSVIGFSFMMSLMQESTPSPVILLTVLFNAGYGLFSALNLFFVSFSAIAIASIIRSKTKPQNTSDNASEQIK